METSPTQRGLSKYIECLWSCSNSSSKPESVTVVPDTCTDIILRYGLNQESELFISGEMTKAERVPIFEGQKYLGIRFKPGFLSPLIDLPMSELTDQDVPLIDIHSTLHNLFKPLEIIASQDLQFNQVQTLLQSVLKRYDGIDPLVDYAIALIIKSHGMISIGDLAKETGYSARHLGRLFRKTVGLAPKFFARVVRFQHAKKVGSRDNYFDQSHFLREFKEFTEER